MSVDAQIHWQFKASGDYYTDLAMMESSGRANVENRFGYKGLYQMGNAALTDVGYISRETGQWTGKYNIHSEQDFLSSVLVQNIVIREYHLLIWGYLQNYHQYEGQTIQKIILSKVGMISASHLVGVRGLEKFINTEGAIDNKDGNGIPCSEYLRYFAGYTIDYSIHYLVAELSKQQTLLA